MSSMRDDQWCFVFDTLPLNGTGCAENARVLVPQIYHSIAGTAAPPRAVQSVVAMNPTYRLNYHNDASGLEYVRAMCGERVARAFACFTAPANRADIFRFCALYASPALNAACPCPSHSPSPLATCHPHCHSPPRVTLRYAQGGVYLDADIVPLWPLDRLYKPCARVSLGRDLPPGTQMKIAAGEPRNAVWKCMLRRIVQHVAWRYIPPSSLSVSGPLLLTKCVAKTRMLAETALTYKDTRNAAWPYTGMRTDTELLALERPNEARHWRGSDASDYARVHRERRVYTSTCSIPREQAS